MAKYVIVGASAAGIGAVEAIRQVDQTGAITVITEEPCAYYSRPMISDLVSGKADAQKMKCKTDDFFQQYNADALLNKKVTALNLT
jgi:NAD(P)H-nitrite reductase large subunit